jgi:superfamily II DNA or RNA helicase
MEPSPILLSCEGGTVVLAGAPQEQLLALPHCQADPRTGTVRAEGRHYRDLVMHLTRSKIPFTDQARAWEKDRITWTLRREREPFPHQTEALETWWKSGGRGLVVLPTGTGKTFLAILAIVRAGKPTLVVTPTIDLLHQWYGELIAYFGEPVGLLGGGYYDFQTITVSTYDSAHIHLERWAHKYGLLVLDECHHLPGPTYSNIALGALAPYRLGLTATPERADGQEIAYPALVGPVVYRREIPELAGDFLKEYRTERVYVDLTPQELEQYQTARDTFRRFVADAGISLGGPNGWQSFINASCRSVEGRAAFKAYREQRRLALAAPAKLRELERLLEKHRRDRVLIFTYDNATVYQIARRFLVATITHQTKTKERKQILESFHAGELNILVTSQVLNEGVDVPAANVGIILSGTATVREHVQRLGRILRKHADKQALLYEVIARGTAEEFVSDRRRQHHAYR